jgi:1-acyl-sn-glycerol-3-phosphate acyltransferase
MVGKMEVGKWPMARTAAKITKPILVNRSKLKSLVATMKKIKESVDQKIPVILFPEGTTHTGPLTKPFKNGSFKIAADSQIPIIPLAIYYPDPGVAWVGNDTFIGHFFRQMGTLSTKVVMRYGTPIIHSDYEILKKQTREQIDSMLTEMAGLNIDQAKLVPAE